MEQRKSILALILSVFGLGLPGPRPAPAADKGQVTEAHGPAKDATRLVIGHRLMDVVTGAGTTVHVVPRWTIDVPARGGASGARDLVDELAADLAADLAARGRTFYLQMIRDGTYDAPIEYEPDVGP